jgi:hypothetical protein
LGLGETRRTGGGSCRSKVECVGNEFQYRFCGVRRSELQLPMQKNIGKKTSICIYSSCCEFWELKQHASLRRLSSQSGTSMFPLPSSWGVYLGRIWCTPHRAELRFHASFMEPMFWFVHYEETLNFEHEAKKTSTAKLASTSSGNSFCVARMPNFRPRRGIFKTATRLKEVWGCE